MAYDKSIEKRIDGLIAARPNMEKKKMFGGVCYLTRGNMVASEGWSTDSAMSEWLTIGREFALTLPEK
ncbi:MAG: hypothetical protein WCP20_19240 [Desulfuromonadales bacterium]